MYMMKTTNSTKLNPPTIHTTHSIFLGSLRISFNLSPPSSPTQLLAPAPSGRTRARTLLHLWALWAGLLTDVLILNGKCRSCDYYGRRGRGKMINEKWNFDERVLLASPWKVELTSKWIRIRTYFEMTMWFRMRITSWLLDHHWVNPILFVTFYLWAICND